METCCYWQDAHTHLFDVMAAIVGFLVADVVIHKERPPES